MNRSARLKRLGFTRSRGHKPQSQPRKEQGDRSRRRLRRRLSGGLLLLIALTVSGGRGRRADPHSAGRRRRRVGRGAAAQRQAAVRHLLRVLPRRQPAGRARPRAQPDRRRRRGRLLPGVHRPDARDARRGAGATQRRRSSTRPRSTRSAHTCRPTVAAPPWCATPTAASRCSRCAAATWAAAATCSGSTAPRATTSPARAARCRRASSRPTWEQANEQQILTAMLTGPQNMPKFSDRQLSFEAEEGHHRLRQGRQRGDSRPAAMAWAASDPRPRAWRCGSSGWSPPSGWHCGLGREHERRLRHRQRHRDTPRA